MMDVLITSILLGTLVGLLLALTGAGGAVISAPLLVFVQHLSVVQAAPVGLLAVMLAASVGAAQGLKEGIVRYKAAGLMASFGLLCAPLGFWLAHRISNLILTLLLCVLLVYLPVKLLRKPTPNTDASGWDGDRDTLACRVDASCGKLTWTVPCARRIALSGCLAGFASGLLGVGGGFVIVPALRSVSNLEMKSIVATSLFTIAIVSAGSVTLAIVKSTMLWQIALPFAGAAVIGMVSGNRLAKRIPERVIQQLFAVLVLLVAGGLIIKQFL